MPSLAMVAALASACAVALPQPRESPVGAVAATDRRAVEAGAAMLRIGGNAADAAVATALALAVVYPVAGNLGGGGFAVARFAQSVTSIDFRETAPAAATAGMFLDAAGNPLTAASRTGPLAAGVPGTPFGLYALHQRYGRLPWRHVVEPAIVLADKGFVVDDRLSRRLAWRADDLRRFPESASTWLSDGAALAAGTWLRLPALAHTLRVLAADGPMAWAAHAGPAIAAAVHTHGGILTATDVTSYTPIWRAPLEYEAFGWRVATMDLPSSGGILSAWSTMALGRLGGQFYQPESWERRHLMVEIWRRAYARRAWLGDPAAGSPTAATLLLSDAVAAALSDIRLQYATPSTSLAHPATEAVASVSETTHLSVVDAEGNAVAMTVTLNGPFGCGLYVPELGIFLNNEMDDFTIAPGHANQFGLLQGDANAVAPGRRMLSSMTPTIAWNDASVLALGSPGGSRIPTAVMQVLWARIVDHLDLMQAVARPRIHHQWLPDALVAEHGALDPGTTAALVARGHRVEPAGEWPIGEVNAVERSGAQFVAAPDPRGPAAGAVVFRSLLRP